jgi:sarcosine oxidase
MFRGQPGVSQSRRTFDAIVLGVGGMGSAAVHYLAKRGLRVLGLEQFDIPHAMGSSHGVTRLIRKAYFEHPSYVPLLIRSYQLWNDLASESRRPLLRITGSVDVGRPGTRILDGSLDSCLIHKLDHELLDAEQLNGRFPGYNAPPGFQAVYQPEGGFLLSEECIVAYCFRALENGGEIHGREKVVAWRADTGGIEVKTNRESYSTARLIVTAGPWVGQLLPMIARICVPERQVLGWFQPVEPRHFDPSCFPVFNMTVNEGHFYGFPVYGVPGFKLGWYHHLEEKVDADGIDRAVYDRDEAPLRDFIARYFPLALGPTLSLKTCMFTNTPDEHFIIDRHPDHPGIVIAAGFSGHGFKFASVIGEIVADLAIDGSTRHDISLFKMDRFDNARSND